MQITDKNIERYLAWWHRERHLARTDLVWLSNKVLGYPDVSERVHGPIIDVLQKFPGAHEGHRTVEDYREAMAGKVLWEPKCKMELLPPNEGYEQSRDNLILYPRGHIKTTIVSVAHSIMWVLNYPNVRILGTTATETLITSIVLEIRNHFVLNEQLRLLFPELCPQSKEGKIPDFGNLSGFTCPARDNNNKKLGPGGKEPTFLASTVGSAITGYHGDVQKCDDLVEKINSSSQNGIDDVIRHAGSMGDLLEKYNTEDVERPLKGWVDMVGTPWDFSDLYQVRRNDHAARRAKGLKDAFNLVVRSAAPNWPEGPFLWPERMGYTALKEIEDDPMKGPGQLCTPGYSPVLMADLTEKPISQVSVGDMVMGFERDESYFRGKMRLKPTKVLAVHALGKKPCQRIFTNSGRTADCTPEHKWFTGRYSSSKEPHRKVYAPAKVGFDLTSVLPPLRDLTIEQQRWMDWLGGLMDGEGSCFGRNTLFISQSPDANPEVCLMICECLNALGYGWTQFEREANSQNGRNSSRGRQFMLKGGRKVAREVYVRARMAKRQRIYDSIMAKALLSEKSSGNQRVKRIEEIMAQPVFGLTTETGNYVVWGFASSNSAQYLMNPIVAGQGLIDDVKQLIWTPEKVMDQLLPRMSLYAALDVAGMEDVKGHDSDFTVLTVGGFANARLYIPFMLYGRPTVEEVVEWVFRVFEQYPNIVKLKIQKQALERVLLSNLRREMSKRGKFLPLDAQPANNRQSKQNKIRGLRPWFVGGNIRFSDSLPYRTAIETEIKGFPRYSHDDILDTIAELMIEGRGVNPGVMSNRMEEMSVASTLRDPISLLLAEHYQDDDAFYPKVDRDTGFPA